MSAARNGEDEGMPHAPRPRARDVLSDGEDVTGLSERALVIRAVNSTLETEQHLGDLLGSMARIELDVRDIKLRLAPNGEIEHRARQTSVTAIEELAPVLAAELRKATLDARDGHGNLTESRATEIVERLLNNRDLAGYQRGSKQREKLFWIVVVAIVGVAATYAGGHFEGRATAPQTQQTK